MANAAHAAEIRDGNGDWVNDSGSRMVFHAVLEGLFTDGVSKEHAALIFPSEEKFNEHFVYSCPLCHPAVEALRLYKSHSHFEFMKPLRWKEVERTFEYPHTFGDGLDATTAQRLESKDRNERIAVIQELIQRWVARKLNAMRLSAQERAKWKAHLEGLRERGMSSLQHLQRSEPANAALSARKTCPACEGSAGACSIAAEPAAAVQPRTDFRSNICPDVFFAVLEELYRSGASAEELAVLLPGGPEEQRAAHRKHFVYGCTLCRSVWEAMRLYKNRPAFYGRKDGATTFGKGLEPAIALLLTNEDRLKRMIGIQRLVAQSVIQRMDALRLNAQEKSEWAVFLKKLSEQGMSMLNGPEYAGWKFCPSCEGSSGACKLEAKPKGPAMGLEF